MVVSGGIVKMKQVLRYGQRTRSVQDHRGTGQAAAAIACELVLNKPDDGVAAVSLVCGFGSGKLDQAGGKVFAVEGNIAILVGFRLRFEVGEIELPRIEQVRR
jgi:hypothetical protein